jgi:para-nitrobenzyl esterase
MTQKESTNMDATRSSLGRLAALCALPVIALAGLVLATDPSSAAATSSRRVAVHIDSGLVRGLDGGAIATYLGIPYAAPPTGNLRWRPPQRVTAWRGVRDASQFGPSCPQAQAKNPFLPPGALSEDCLYLNVYAPASPGRSGRRPVLVWIHGGGLVQDGARNYDGSKLAANGVVVVVTINYRLGALGFLAHPALAASPGGPAGNYGWMDQQAALRWIQRNIAGFGGDPRNVTIAGQSAGGLSVLAHLVSRGSHGLFQRAIVQSGAFALQQQPLADAESAGQDFADVVGCAQHTADCLRHASVTDLVNDFGVAIPGYVDGSVLTESIGAALAGGRFARVPVLNGINHDEERLFVDALGIAVSGGTDALIPDQPITDANYQSDIAAVMGVSAARAANVVAEYPTSAYASADVAFSTLVSDANFACPARQVDQWTSPRVPTFGYQFNDDNAPFVLAPPTYFPAVATHDSELPYLFDQPNTPFPATLDSGQQALADTMRAAWANFAARGDPSSPALTWPSYAYGASVMSLATPQSAASSSFAAMHHCAFWNAG